MLNELVVLSPAASWLNTVVPLTLVLPKSVVGVDRDELGTVVLVALGPVVPVPLGAVVAVPPGTAVTELDDPPAPLLEPVCEAEHPAPRRSTIELAASAVRRFTSIPLPCFNLRLFNQ